MRVVFAFFVTLSVSLFLTIGLPADGQGPPTPPQPTGLPPDSGAEGQPLVGRLGEIAAFDEAVAAGLPRGSHPTVLTLETAYALALIRDRAPRRKPGEDRVALLQPMTLDEWSRRFEVADFGRFRREFLAGRAGEGDESKGFRDPAPGFFELLSRLQAVETGRQRLVAIERIAETYRQFLAGGSGIQQAHVDRSETLLTTTRVDQARREAAYRDALDAYAVELGLPPRATFIPDRSILAAYRVGFDAQLGWMSKDSESRERKEIAGLIDLLPKLDDISFDGKAILGSVNEPDAGREAGLVSATRISEEHRPGVKGDDRAELRLRKRIRELQGLRIAYEAGKRRLEAALRDQDHAQDSLNAPPAGPGVDEAANVAEATFRLIEANDARLRVQDDLVATWARFHAERLALYRDLGALPFDSWPVYYAQFRTLVAPAKR